MWQKVYFLIQFYQMEKKKLFCEARLKTMMAQLITSIPRDLNCQGGNPIHKLCINSQCDRSSLHCGTADCSACPQSDHQNCQNTHLSTVVKTINSQVDSQKETIDKVVDLQTKFINDLKKTNYSFVQDCYLNGLEKKNKDLFEDIFLKKDPKNVKGREAKELFDQKSSNQVLKNSIQTYQTALQSVLKSAEEMKKQICRAMNSQQIMENFQSSILSNQWVNRYQQIDFLMNLLQHPKKVKRIFRASDHEFKASSFHQHCDNKKDTLLLVKTEFGKIVGGFTHYPWTSDEDGSYVDGSDRKAFLFSLSMKEKFVPQGDQFLIYRASTYGPYFGGETDLFIADRCDSNRVSCAQFPGTYNRSGQNKLEKTQEGFSHFTGATSGNNFQVQQYQVFQVHQQ